MPPHRRLAASLLVAALPSGAAAQAIPLVAPPPPAEPPELEARASRVSEAFSARRASPARDRWTGFVREGRTRVLTVDVRAPRCLGFAAVGPARMDDLDLAVSNSAGAELARDDRRDAHPYVRVCPTAPTTLYVRVTAARGNGDVSVITMGDPPLVPPPLDDVLPPRPSSGFAGARVPRAEVGRDPAALSAREHLARLTARLDAAGARPSGVTHAGQLTHQQTTQQSVRLEAGRCYVAQAAGGDHVDDLDLRVLAPDRRPIVQDVSADARPAVRFCAREGGEHLVGVRMFSGSGEWAFALYELPDDDPRALGGDVVGVARARALEVTAEATRRGMRPMREAVRGAAWGAGALPFGVTLRAGRCYLFGAAADAQLPAVDLWLSAADGAVLASDTNERERAMVFHCARRDGRATATVRPHGGRGEYVFLAYHAEDAR